MDPYRLLDRICARDFTLHERDGINDADALLGLIVEFATADGYYHGHPNLVGRLMWWKDDYKELGAQWLAELIERGEVTIHSDLARSSFGDHHVDILRVENRHRHPRWSPTRRPHIPNALRRQVYERDGHACRECGTADDLSLDHVHPYSCGGQDTLENLRTLCRPCNSRKGARV